MPEESTSDQQAPATGEGQSPSGDQSAQPQSGSQAPNPAQEQSSPQGGDQHGEGNQEPPDYKALYEETLSEARKWEQRAKSNREKADQFDKLDEQNKSEAQKATDRAEKAEDNYARAIAAAVRAEVKAAASGWADPDDAPRYLDDLAAYVSEYGEIDTKAIHKDVGAALKQRPYLSKQDSGVGGNGHGMSPDPGQGSRGGSIGDQIATAEQNGDVRTSLALKAQQLLANKQ